MSEHPQPGELQHLMPCLGALMGFFQPPQVWQTARADKRGPRQACCGREDGAEEVSLTMLGVIALHALTKACAVPCVSHDTTQFSPLFPSPQHHLLHPGRLAGPVLRGLSQTPRLCLPQAAHLLRAPQHPWFRPGTPSPHPSVPVPAAGAERGRSRRWGWFPARGDVRVCRELQVSPRGWTWRYTGKLIQLN